MTEGETALLGALEQLTNLVAIAMTRGMRQVEAIELLGRSSLSNAQIGGILGTSADSVRGERNRLKRVKQPTKLTRKSSGDAATGA